jgi:two-component system response regulator CpxR
MSDPAPARTRSILLIEDDSSLCRLMTTYFAQHGFSVEAAHDGLSGLSRALDGFHDVIILDVMLPVLDGFGVLRQLRKRSLKPVIMLTARAAHQDRIAGLNTGADDYLHKPFAPEELLARIRAVLRRSQSGTAATPAIVEAGPVRLSPNTRECWLRGELVELTAIEFDILEALVNGAGRTVSRDELTAALFQRRSTPYERSLDVHISHLRRKLEGEGPALIRTIRGIGYLFSPGTGGLG